MAIDDDLRPVLDEHYLQGLADRDVDELRAMRSECQQVEAKLSYLRRLVQGRLDIVSAEIRRRAEGGGASDLADLVEHLPEILADKVHAPGPGRLPTNLVPPEDEDLTAELDAVTGPATLGSLPDLAEADLQGVSHRLEELERRVSAQRRALFDVIEAIQDELASRYEQGAVGR